MSSLKPGVVSSSSVRPAVVTSKPGPGASITMIQPGSKVMVPSVTRAAVATPILRGVTGPVTLRAPLAAGIRLASPGQSVTLLQPGVSSAPLTKVVTAQPGAARSGGAMGTVRSAAPMAAVSFRPSGPLVTTARPTLSPPAPSVTKTIVTQNPAGVFKPITTQVSVTGAPVALKPSPALPVRVPAAAAAAAAAAGQRLTVVSQQPALGAVTLTQPLTSHIQVSVSMTIITPIQL